MEYLFDYSGLIFWLAAALLLLLLIFVIKKRLDKRRLIKSVTFLSRGTKSERRFILELLGLDIHPEAIFHDLIIKKPNGKFSQVDLVVATAEGILVFEIKNYSGWLFGNANHTDWTQILAYGKRRYRFYNPIKQNESHIKALKQQLEQFEHVPFFSIIVFYGDCEFKNINYIPNNTYLIKPHRLGVVLQEIRIKQEPAPYSNKREVISVLQQAVENGKNEQYQKKHINDIDEMLGKGIIF